MNARVAFIEQVELVVMEIEALRQCRLTSRIESDAEPLNGACDQRRDATPDQVAHLHCCERCELFLGQRPIQCHSDIVDRIEQGAVQIKQYRCQGFTIPSGWANRAA